MAGGDVTGFCTQPKLSKSYNLNIRVVIVYNIYVIVMKGDHAKIFFFFVDITTPPKGYMFHCHLTIHVDPHPNPLCFIPSPPRIEQFSLLFKNCNNNSLPVRRPPRKSLDQKLRTVIIICLVHLKMPYKLRKLDNME